MPTNISHLEPMQLSGDLSALEERAIEILKQGSALSRCAHPATIRSIRELLRTMNCYYSNLIEGHNTRPIDIDRALQQDFSSNLTKRNLQLESLAHIEVQKLMETRLMSENTLVITEKSFLCWIHREFYQRVPDDLLIITSSNSKVVDKVIPGELRQRDVQVGDHIAPEHNTLNCLLDRFNKVYNPERKNDVQKILSSAAAHHRLAWIHPFLDGNGRVTRLFSDAYFFKANIDGYGLWNISRGLARRKTDYLKYLAGADSIRQGDLDGRGHLTHKGLYQFTEFFLETILDQIQFMTELLELDKILNRIVTFSQNKIALKQLPKYSDKILAEVYLRGEVTRGAMSEIIGQPERSTRRVISELIKQRLLISDTPKGALRLSFPPMVLGYYFPNLYSTGIDV